MSALSRVRFSGPLLPYRAGFTADLAAKGYTPLSAANQLRVMAHLSRWLEVEGLTPAALTPCRLDEFLVVRRREGYTCWLSLRGLAPVLDYLRALAVVPGPIVRMASTPVDHLVERYRTYLAEERGLVVSTVRYYEAEARLFLACVECESLVADDVTRFVVRECSRRSVGSAKILVTALRSLLRYLFLEALSTADLAAAVPAVAGWRGSTLPKALGRADVKALLAACDRRRAVGRRDYAILTLLVRLGLRAGEVAALTLADIDWRAGDIVVRGKGCRDERLPLPVDVGEALVAYMRRSRPKTPFPEVFLRDLAPHGALTTGSVTAVVRSACVRAGLAPVGAHRLRHTAATEMLRAGTPLAEVGQVLRHRSVTTTALYAKVDRIALRGLAQPWPGGAA